MQIIPLPNDTIETKDGAKLIVAGFNNFKSKGPAVFCKSAEEGSQQFLTVYFFDIDKINDVRVEFSSSSKIFTALGRVKRRIHLPQPHDFIFVFNKEEGASKDKFDDSQKVKVAGYKLHSKKHGVSKGLLIEDVDKNVYMLDEVLDLRREIGSSEFDRKVFLRIYKEYIGHKA
jgi:hypothetical protein